MYLCAVQLVRASAQGWEYCEYVCRECVCAMQCMSSTQGWEYCEYVCREYVCTMQCMLSRTVCEMQRISSNVVCKICSAIAQQ